MSDKSYAVTVAILYGVFILISFGDPAMMLAVGRPLLGEHIDLFFSLVPYGIVSLLLVYLTFAAKETRAGRFLFLMAISIVLFFIVRYLNGEREKVHLIEFALLGGILVWSATVWRFNRHTAYLFAIAAGLIVVGCDELLQISLSIKIFSARDILVNIMAAALGAVTYGGLFRDSPHDEEEAKASL